jgi:uncharacterized membrane-anchored protein
MRAIELKLAFDAAAKVARRGPVETPPGDQAALKPLSGCVFALRKEAAPIMGAPGNGANTVFLGLTSSEAPPDNSFFTVHSNETGCVRDDEARTWNVGRLLGRVRNSAGAANRPSIENGLPPIEVEGWAAAPRHDAATHHLARAAPADKKTLRLIPTPGSTIGPSS